MYVSVTTLSIGRLLVGIGSGTHNVAFGKALIETMPSKLQASFAMAVNISICIGTFVVFVSGAALPDYDDEEANRETEAWRVIWFGPAVVGLIVILLAIVVFRHEPIGYCVMTGNNLEGVEHLKKVYRKKNPGSPETIDELITQ